MDASYVCYAKFVKKQFSNKVPQKSVQYKEKFGVILKGWFKKVVWKERSMVC